MALLLLVVRVVLLNSQTLQDQPASVGYPGPSAGNWFAGGGGGAYIQQYIAQPKASVVPVVHTEVEETGLVIALTQMGDLMLDRPVQQIVGLVVWIIAWTMLTKVTLVDQVVLL